MLADQDTIAALRLRWRRICNAFIAIAHLHGLDVGDIYATGTPIRLDIETWCSVSLVEGPGAPVALIRSQPPSGGVLSAALEADDAAVAADIADAIDALRRRRSRVLDQDRHIAEQELAEMATSTGWRCDGVGGRKPMTAAFHDDLDRVRGRLIRTDRADGDPAEARFGITVEVGSLTYAQALEYMASIQCAHGREQQQRAKICGCRRPELDFVLPDLVNRG
jgi:hypothetical protein